MVLQGVPLVAAWNFSCGPVDSGSIDAECGDITLVTIVDLDGDAGPLRQVSVLVAFAHYEQQFELGRLGKGLHGGGRPFSSLGGNDRHVLTSKQVKQLLLLAGIHHGARCTTGACHETSVQGAPRPWCSSSAPDCLIALSWEKKGTPRSAELRTFKKQSSTMARAHANQEPLQTLSQKVRIWKVDQAACFFTEARSCGRPKSARSTKSGSKARRYCHARNISSPITSAAGPAPAGASKA